MLSLSLSLILFSSFSPPPSSFLFSFSLSIRSISFFSSRNFIIKMLCINISVMRGPSFARNYRRDVSHTNDRNKFDPIHNFSPLSSFVLCDDKKNVVVVVRTPSNYLLCACAFYVVCRLSYSIVRSCVIVYVIHIRGSGVVCALVACHKRFHTTIKHFYTSSIHNTYTKVIFSCTCNRV